LLSVELGENTAPQSVAEAAVGNFDSVSAVGTTPKRRGGGGGGGRAKRARDTRTVDEMFAPMMRDEITDDDLLGGMRGATLSGADQAAIDVQAEWAAAVGDGNDELANRTAALTLEISLATEWASAWESAYGRVNPLQFLANSLVTSYTNVVGAGIRAAVTYGASVKQSMLDALAATASTMAVEAGLNAIKALATGLYLTATRQYDAAASSFASAAQWATLTALAGSVSYASGASASSGKKSSGAQVSGGGYETPLTGGRQAREDDRVTNITLNLDGEVIYDSVANHDRSRSVSGRSRIGAY
jgi:hypothetical protein